MTFLRSAGLLAATAALALPAASAAPASAAQAPRVPSMIVGKSAILGGLRTVTADAATIRVGSRRCAVAAGTPLSVLVARGISFDVKDFGRCGPQPADSAGLYVTRIGPDRRGGQAGWVYKVGHRIGTTGAADPSGPFGTGKRLRTGQPVLWFWCRQAGRCQRTLEIAAPERVGQDEPFTITVRGYDDQGRGRPIRGVTLKVGTSEFTTDANGRATVRATAAGRLTLRASKPGLVDAFPQTVTVR
ncbi:MAG TPA: carboxypeptidase-like regulatory domain-containing protein [Capillimicrobium sp.]|nr:carboxypeptidase-like regulatory domain-containing protein [Capillimicrobium sp.]